MSVIDKLAWVHIEDRKVLFIRSKGRELFYTPGGKRNEGETDEMALVREIKEELNVDLKPETLQHLNTFKAQAHGQPEGTMVEIKCYKGDFDGKLEVGAEIEELDWFTSEDTVRTTPTGQLILQWLKKYNLIN